MWDVGGRNSRSGVGHLKQDTLSVASRPQDDVSTSGCELDRISNEVADQLRYTKRISAHDEVFNGRRDFEADAALQCRGLQRFRCLTKNRGDCDVLEIERELSRLQ